ncbi:MAG: hypothetical protein ABI882_03850 [Acidobacteriota bacterium]
MIRSLVRPLFSNRSILLWLLLFGVLGVALIFLYPDADQQDAGYHYLFARWSWHEPYYLIGVWTRPLFTLIYSFPAQFGYRSAKVLTLLICLMTAIETYRLAARLGFERAEWVFPLLLLQPAYFLLYTETQTESLFALVFVIALNLHYAGRTRAAMLAASMLILIRPEGFFLGCLWALWTLQYSREWPWWRRLLETLWLAIGALAWWVAAALITGDTMWIVHDWPADWHATSIANGRGPIVWYVILLPLIVGPLLLPAFVVGLSHLIRRREFLLGVSSFLALFLLHSVLFWQGWFGAAGYPRYLVCVSPAIAVVTLCGWNRMTLLSDRRVRVAVLIASFLVCLFYVDGYRFTRDSRAIDDAIAWLERHPISFSRLVYSQSYMCIRLNCSSNDRPSLTNDREHNLDLLNGLPSGTLIFWDGEVGPKWYGLRAADFEKIGYRRLWSSSYHLEGWFFRLPWRYHGGPRLQEIDLYFK